MKRVPPTLPTLGAALVVLALASCGPDASPTQPTTQTIPPPAFAIAPNTWTAKARMLTDREFLDAGVANRAPGKPVLYAIGGEDNAGDGVPGNVVEAYDFATNSWTTKASLPVATENSNGVGLIGGKLYLSGAGGGQRLYVYDPVRNSWTRKRDLPHPTEKGVTGVINGKLYVLADDCLGCIPADPGRRLYRYDPATNVWSLLPRSPQGHAWGAGGAINGKFYVAGGIGRSGPTNQLQVYDPATNKWATKAAMPGARTDVAGAVLKGKLYILGGFRNGTDLATVQAYDPVTNTWQTRAHMLTVRRNFAAASGALDGQPLMMAVGGVGAGGSTEVYAP